MFPKRILSVAFLLYFPITTFAQSGSPASEPWYKIIVGVIGIPAALLGVMISYRLFRKTNLESRKLELEIQEKENKFQQATDNEGMQALRELAEPIGFSQRLSLLILRFIILELTLRLWEFVPFVVGRILSLATSSLFMVVGTNIFSGLPGPGSFGGATIFISQTLLGLAFDFIRWFIIFGFGWPLLKDAASLMGFSLKGIFDVPFFWRRKHKKAA